MSPYLFLTATFAAASLLGCQSAPMKPMPFRKAGASQEQFLADRYQCLREAQQVVSGAAVVGGIATADSRVVTNCQLATSCMGARGYTPDPNGNLVTPEALVVNCGQ